MQLNRIHRVYCFFVDYLGCFMLKYIIAFLVLGYSYSTADSFVHYSGEELLYEVSFMSIKLGTIKIVTGNKKKEGNKDIIMTKAYIDTYKGIPFVDIHVVYESFTDYSFSYSHRFFGNFKTGSYTDLQKIFFNYDNTNIYISKENDNGKYFETSIKNEKKTSDGLSLFFFARKFLDCHKLVTVPTVVDKEVVYTKINFRGTPINLSMPNIKYPVKTLYFDGTANWTGVYGLTGGFEGWFSDDQARIPIKAKMKLSVGSVSIDLISWTRKGWVPPRANQDGK